MCTVKLWLYGIGSDSNNQQILPSSLPNIINDIIGKLDKKNSSILPVAFTSSFQFLSSSIREANQLINYVDNNKNFILTLSSEADDSYIEVDSNVSSILELLTIDSSKSMTSSTASSLLFNWKASGSMISSQSSSELTASSRSMLLVKHDMYSIEVRP